MKRIKLHAYFAENLGDDLMIHILLERFPQCVFWYDGVSPGSDKFLRYPNFENQRPLYLKFGRINHILNILTFYRKEDFFIRHLFNRRSKKCDASVMIGGSMFMEFSDAKPEERVAREEARLNVFPRFVIGANFGPYNEDGFKQAFEGYFQRCASVSFRDIHSYNLFSNLPSVSYAPDVVFGLEQDNAAGIANDGTVVISVIDVRSRKAIAQYADQYEIFIVNFCQTCINRGKKPVLVSFCEAEGDTRGIRQILERLPATMRADIGSYEYKGNFDEALNLFQRADFVLATRFHAMILALKFGKPFFSIAYNQKIEWVMKDVRSDAYCRMEDVQVLSPEGILEKYNKPIEITKYCGNAKNHFAKFERFLLNDAKYEHVD